MGSMQNKFRLIIAEILLLATAVMIPLIIIPGTERLRAELSVVTGEALPGGGQNVASPVSADGEGGSPAPPSPRTMARSFYIPVPAPPVSEVRPEEVPPEPEEIKPLPGDGRFKALGVIRDGEDVERLYLKDEQTGRLLKLRLDGGVEDGNQIISGTGSAAASSGYILNIDGVLYSIRR